MSWAPNGLPLPKGGGVHPVVRLAAEIIRLGVEVDPVLLAGDLARGEIVEIVAVAGQVRLLGSGQPSRSFSTCGDVVVAVLLDEVHQQLAVELVGVHALQRRGAAPLPMLDQIAEQLRAPADAAFEEGEVQFREAPRHAAEEDALGGRVAGVGEMADMVVDEVGRRVAQPLAAGARMEGRRDAELDAFRPDRVVIVEAVDAEHVVPHREAAATPASLACGRRDLARHAAAEHADLRARAAW